MAQSRASDGMYAAGVRRTFAISRDAAWRAWAGCAGLQRWLGKLRREIREGEEGELDDGTQVLAVRVRAPHQVRLRLSRPDWRRPRTAQLRIIQAATGVTVALHVEGLPGPAERQATLERWTNALEASGPAPRTRSSGARERATPAAAKTRRVR